jgi:hypothetical protein
MQNALWPQGPGSHPGLNDFDWAATSPINVSFKRDLDAAVGFG